MRKTFTILSAMILGAGMALADEAPVKHIRVIVDTSQSLHETDPNGYVKTATAMFYDLSWQLLGAKDTFEIVPFDPKWPEVKEPPETVGTIMSPGRSEGQRTGFVKDMLETRYESPFTYFSPCMEWSYRDLEKSGPNDQKIVVLITDGLPDPQTIQFDGERLKALVPKLAKAKIKVYVLAFGPKVNESWFQDVFRFDTQDGVTGHLFVGKTADKLLDNMLDIFSQSFGYTRTNFGGQSRIDAAGGANHDRAVVVALYGPGQQPGFGLNTPDGKPVGPAGMYKVKGSADPKAKPNPGTPVSYAYQWLRQPALGDYSFKSAGTPEQIAVLYPGGFNITLRPLGNNPIDAVMAGKSAPMEVVVTPASGTGDVEGKTINFHLHYLKKDDEGTTADASDYPPDQPETGTYVKGVGRVYRINVSFVRDPRGWPAGTGYQGYIDIRVTPTGSNTVLAEKGPNMYPVWVYPYVSLHPTPPDVTLMEGARATLRGGDSVCSEFRFQLQGNSNNLREHDYTLGARIDPPLAMSGPYRGARFRFDGQMMEAASNSRWQATTPFDPSNIDGKRHRFCVVVGSPTSAANSTLTIQFGVWPSSDQRYQSLNVVDSLAAHLKIEAPDFWQIWKPWLMWLLTLLLMGLTYLFFRYRQPLPPDLAVSLAQGEGKLTSAKLGESSPGVRWLGMARERPVISLTGDKELGSVRPLNEELFVFVPAKGYGSVMAGEAGEWLPREARGDGTWLLEAGKKYRVGTGSDARYFRLDYAEERPRI